jgi:hypothetical protein
MWKSSELGAVGLILLAGACSSSGTSNPAAGTGSGAAGSGAGASSGKGTGATGATNLTGGATSCVAGYQGCACDPSGKCATGLSCLGGTCCDALTNSCALPAGTGGNGNANATGGIGACAVGTQGCACDAQQRCASGLGCTNGVCCSGGNCQTQPSGSGGTGAVSTGTGGVLACLSGMQGCACLQGKCAADLTCTNNLCCNKTDCQIPPPPTGTGGTTGAGGAPGQCAPGVIGPVLTDCGYPYSSSNPLTSVWFNESEVLAAIQPVGGSPLATVRLFYNDEHAMTLGVRHVDVVSATGTSGADYPVSPLPASPSSVTYPATGTNALAGYYSGLDQWLRPMWPVLFITDVTDDPNARSGDWQQGGRPWNPNAVFGTWKAAVRQVDTTTSPSSITIEPDVDPVKNTWNLGPGADPVPTAQITKKTEGYSAEVIWYLSLLPGHSYRVQVMVHDGDQNKLGGDVGEACVNFCAGQCEGEGCGGNPWDSGTPPPDGGDGGPPGCPTGVIACGPGTGVYCPEGTACSLGCCLDIL